MTASHAISPQPTRTNSQRNRASLEPEGEGEVAFDAVYAQYGRRLFLVALGILKNPSDAEDAVQESMLRAYTKIASFRGDSAIYTWLTRIVINTSLMVLRRRSRQRDVSLDCTDEEGEFWAERLSAPGLTAEAEAIIRQRQEFMFSAVAALPPRYRAMVSEWIECERTMAELSDQFQISVPGVKSRILRAKEQVVRTVNRRLSAGSLPALIPVQPASNFLESNSSRSRQ